MAFQWNWLHFLGVNEHHTTVVDVSRWGHSDRLSSPIFFCGAFQSYLSFSFPTPDDPWGFKSPGLLTMSTAEGATHNSYLACYAPDGAFLWSKHIEGGSVMSVAADDSGGCLLVGSSLDEFVLVDGQLLSGPPEYLSVAAIYAFVVRFDSDGNLLWGPNRLGPLQSVTRVVWDPQCARFALAFVAGGQSDVTYVYFDGGSNDATIKASSGSGVFVAQFGSDGSGKNIANFSGTVASLQYGGSSLYLGGVDVDAAGNNAWFVTKCNASLTPSWSKTQVPPGVFTGGGSVVLSIDFDETSDSVWALGAFWGPMVAALGLDPLFGGFPPIAVQTLIDAFVLKIDSTGVVQWARQSLTEYPGRTTPGYISVDGHGGAVISAFSGGYATFWPVIAVGPNFPPSLPPPPEHPEAKGSYISTGNDPALSGGITSFFHLNASGYARGVTTILGEAGVFGAGELFDVRGIAAAGNTLVVGGGAYGDLIFSPTLLVPAQGTPFPVTHGVITIGSWA